MIYTLISLLFFLWLVGLVSHIGGGFIHTLLVLAIAIFLFDMITGRRSAV
ncbi:MAG: lmo0937 family membrane protein [Cyanobacteria bacterium REEB67]|nr:lmo0937 family membrane protein [Cyanobacteria bacterium REEB67]